MKPSFKALAALCSLAISVNTGCSGNPASSGESTSDSGSSAPRADSTVTVEAVNSTPAEIKKVSEKDLTPATRSDSTVTFSESGAEVTGNGVSANGSVVTISQPGTYSITGSCPDGQLIINCGGSDDVFLILNNVDLTCTNAPAILCENAGKLTVTLAENSVNSLSDGTGYTTESGEDTGAALFSRDTLVINGTGALSVNGIYKDGIVCKDGLKLCGGTISVTSAEDGIIGKDYLLAAAGEVTVNSGLDCIKSTNSAETDKGYVSVTGGSYRLISGNDGIQAETSLNISGGEINIISGGGSSTVEYQRDDNGGMTGGRWGDFSDMDGSFDFGGMTDSSGSSADSMKGLKAGSAVIISGGSITADCADDAIHSNGSVTIDGGSFTLSSGDDGIHADTVLSVSNGEINIITSNEGLEGTSVEINGGTIGMTAFDDGINAGGTQNIEDSYISISGGSITVNSGGDGVDSNGTVSMSGGTLVVFGPTNNGNGALDYESSFAMSGGTLIALGSKGMAQAPSTLSQPCLSVYGNAGAGSTIEVRNSDGEAIISTVTPKICQSLIFSTGEFVTGQTYSVYADEELIAEVTATDGVSGGGASGNGFGSWNHDGDAPWSGGNNPDRGSKDEFSRPDNPGNIQPPDGEAPEMPPDGEMPALPDMEIDSQNRMAG